jgi:hypothetical protein
MAEIRDPDNWPADPCWYYNGWIPAWGGLYPNCYANWFVMTKKAEFACSSEFVEGLLVTEGPTFGTVVTIHLDSDETVMYAKEYLWDLQSAETFTWEIDPETSEPDPDTYVFGGVHTWRQGTVTVLPDYTIKPTKVVPTSP